MNDKFQYVLATLAISFGSQWAIRFFKSKAIGKNEEIINLNLIIDRMRMEIDRLEEKIDKMRMEFEIKDAAYSAAFSCPHHATCPVMAKLNQK